MNRPPSVNPARQAPRSRKNGPFCRLSLVNKRRITDVLNNRVNTMSSFVPQNAYSREVLLECGHDSLFGPGNAQHPVPYMLMLDCLFRIGVEGRDYYKRTFNVAQDD